MGASFIPMLTFGVGKTWTSRQLLQNALFSTAVMSVMPNVEVMIAARTACNKGKG